MQSDIAAYYDALNSCDEIEALDEVRVGRWQAWPVVKIYLLGRFFARLPTFDPGRSDERSTRRPLAHLFRDGVLALKPSRLGGSDRAILCIGVRKDDLDRDGQTSDFFFGRLPQATIDRSTVRFLSFPRQNDIAESSPGSLGPLLARARILAKPLSLLQLDTARRLAGSLPSSIGGVTAGEVARVLANFEARRLLFRRHLERAGPRLIILTYAPGRMPEVAAARECGIPVLELQHGVFGATDPDYQHAERLAPLRSAMPIPDRIAVFGDAFRDILVNRGFWRGEYVSATGCAAIDRAVATRAGVEPGLPLVTIFSQLIFRDEIRRTLLEAAATSDWSTLAGTMRFRLALHPEEEAGERFFAPLRDVIPRLEIVPAGGNPLNRIAQSAIVVSATSLALVEACALGQIAISIAGADGRRGLSSVFPLAGIEDAVPHVASGEALVRLLSSLDDEQSEVLRVRASQMGARLYARGWDAKVRAIIADMISTQSSGRS